jgi:hypothetical protein
MINGTVNLIGEGSCLPALANIGSRAAAALVGLVVGLAIARVI